MEMTSKIQETNILTIWDPIQMDVTQSWSHTSTTKPLLPRPALLEPEENPLSSKPTVNIHNLEDNMGEVLSFNNHSDTSGTIGRTLKAWPTRVLPDQLRRTCSWRKTTHYRYPRDQSYRLAPVLPSNTRAPSGQIGPICMAPAIGVQ